LYSLYDREISIVAEMVGLPEYIVPEHHECRVDRDTALAMVLAFLAFPVRKMTDMEDLFHRDERKICA
jgi:hypothetical protein